MDLDFVCIECEVVTDVPVHLTAVLYNALSNFEAQFKASCCPTFLEPCASCSVYVECPYRIVFDQGLSSNPEIVRLHQKPSLPFSLYINGIDGNTSSCTVGMVVVGCTVNYIGVFYSVLLQIIDAAVREVLAPELFTLHSFNLDYQGARHVITGSAALPESMILLSGQHILQNTVHSDSVRLSLKAPLRLLSNGSIAHRFDFGMFFRSQLRRCSSLCAYYGTGELDVDYVRLSEAAQNVVVYEDTIHFAQPLWSKRLSRAGLIGIAECAGLVEPMLSLLLLGSYFNAGKGATYGSGFHTLELID